MKMRYRIEGVNHHHHQPASLTWHVAVLCPAVDWAGHLDEQQHQHPAQQHVQVEQREGQGVFMRRGELHVPDGAKKTLRWIKVDWNRIVWSECRVRSARREAVAWLSL